jgi:hypothetical protein
MLARDGKPSMVLQQPGWGQTSDHDGFSTVAFDRAYDIYWRKSG